MTLARQYGCGGIGMTKKFWIKLTGGAVAAIAAGASFGLTSGVNKTIESIYMRASSWVEAQTEQMFPLPQADQKAVLSIFVANLDGDTDGSQTKHLLQSLRHVFDATDDRHRIEVKQLRRALREGDSGDVFRDHQKARETGKEWLKLSGAHLLIWGHVADRNKALRIFFLPAEGHPERRPSETYILTERFQFSEDFGEDLGTAIAVSAVAQIASKFGYGKPFDDSFYQRIKALAGQKLLSQTKGGCELESALGVFVHCWASQDETKLHEAIGIFQKVIGDRRCANDHDLVARIQSQLGMALSTLGEREVGTARLEEAVAAYREALRGPQRERAPLERAITYYDQSNALLVLGKREGGSARLEEAATAYRSALDISRSQEQAKGRVITSNVVVAASQRRKRCWPNAARSFDASSGRSCPPTVATHALFGWAGSAKSCV